MMSGGDLDRYDTVDGKRIRRPDPTIPAILQPQLIAVLDAAQADMARAAEVNDAEGVARATLRVEEARLALGISGRAWWLPPARAATQARLRATIRTLLRHRQPPATICPSDAARVVGKTNWRALMDDTKGQAWALAEEGWLEVTQKGEAIKPPFRGPIRLRRTDET